MHIKRQASIPTPMLNWRITGTTWDETPPGSAQNAHNTHTKKRCITTKAHTQAWHGYVRNNNLYSAQVQRFGVSENRQRSGHNPDTARTTHNIRTKSCSPLYIQAPTISGLKIAPALSFSHRLLKPSPEINKQTTDTASKPRPHCSPHQTSTSTQ